MNDTNKSPTFSVLPKNCLSAILLFTSPRDACSAAAISKSFKSAADSDSVWEQFLPSDYRELIARAVSPVVFYSKKQLYRLLSESYILLDRGYLAKPRVMIRVLSDNDHEKGFKLDNRSGKKCYMFGARDLTIALGECASLEWGHVSDSRFAEVAIVRDAWPLDIEYKVASVMLSGKTTYIAFLVYQTTEDSFGLCSPSHTTVKFRGVWNGSTDNELQDSWSQGSEAQQKEGWIKIKLGEFYYDGENEGEVEMEFVEYEDYISGLIVEGIELRPK